MTNGGRFKMKMAINRHSPRLMPNNCKNLNPRYFSLPSTFKLGFFAGRISEAPMVGMGGAQRPVLHVNEPKKTGEVHGRARAAKTH